MKKIVLFIATVALLISCGGDDDSSNGTANLDYLPLTVGNNWDYEVVTGTITLNDNLEVTSESNGSYTLTSTPDPANGLMTGFLSSGELSKDPGRLLINGSLGFNFQGVGDFSIDVMNGPIYDQNANPNQEIFSTSGTFNETIDGLDLDINYTATNIQLANEPSITVPAGTYTDVIHSQTIINVTISTDIEILGLTQTITLLDPQDVIVIDNYWAENVGLIKSDNQLEYELEDFSGLGFNLPLPQSADVLTVQSLTTATIN